MALGHILRRFGLVAVLLVACAGPASEQIKRVAGEPTQGAEALEIDSARFRCEVTDPGQGVEVLAPSCQPSQEETCNAVDDDCDGDLDEGCGYEGGAIQITAGWSNGADVDLYVRGPLGEIVSFQRPYAPSGAQMNQVGRGDCAGKRANSRVESIRWVGSQVREGEYEVQAHYWGECLSGTGTTQLVVSVRMGDNVVHSYQTTLRPGQRRNVFKVRATRL